MWQGWGSDTWLGWDGMDAPEPGGPSYFRFIRPIAIDIFRDIANDIGAD